MMCLDLFRKKPVEWIIPLELGPVGPGEGIGRRVFPEQGRRDRVDQLVGALGGQDRGHEDLERVNELERGPSLGIVLPQQTNDGLDAQARAVHAASFPAPSGADVKEILSDVKILDVIVVGEFDDELELGPDHSLVASLDPAQIGQDPAPRFVLDLLPCFVVIRFRDLLRLEGGFEKGRDGRVGRKRDRRSAASATTRERPSACQGSAGREDGRGSSCGAPPRGPGTSASG